MSTFPVSGPSQTVPSSPLFSDEKTPLSSNNSSSISSNSTPRSSGCLAFVESIISRLQAALSSFLAIFGIGEAGALKQLIKNPVKFLQLLDPSKQVVNPNNPDIDMKNEEGKTILFLLCEREGDELTLENGTKLTITSDMIKQVISKDARSLAAGNGQHPMHVMKSSQTAQLLFENGKHGKYALTDSDNNGQYPLHIASTAGRTDVVAWILKNLSQKCFAQGRDKAGSTPLHYAANLEVARAIVNFDIDSICQANALKEYPFQTAIKNGRQDVAEFLVQEMTHNDDVYYRLINHIRVEDLRVQRIGELVLQNLPPVGTENGVLYRDILSRKVYQEDEGSPLGKLLIANGVKILKEKPTLIPWVDAIHYIHPKKNRESS